MQSPVFITFRDYLCQIFADLHNSLNEKEENSKKELIFSTKPIMCSAVALYFCYVATVACEMRTQDIYKMVD